MTRTKEPAAQEASARRAVVGNSSRETPRQTVLPLLPDLGENVEPPRSGRVGDAMANAKAKRGESENASSSREEKPVRRERLKSSFSAVNVKRAVKAVSTAGLPVDSVEIRPDGTIVLATTRPANDGGNDVFEAWADRL